jgi:predicted glycosyltransferase
MNIWFDISNSPHINMFRALIDDLGTKHKVIITCRPLANTVQLLRKHEMEHTVVGFHYGRSLARKTMGFPLQVARLVNFLRKKEIDVAISQSSFHSPVVARLLGIRSIYLNDNEHAAGNVAAFAFADTIMVPEFMSLKNLARQGARMKKVIRYPGVKEGIYLWECYERALSVNRERNNTTRHRIFIRPEPTTAQYYHGPCNFLDGVIKQLQKHAEVTILPRSADQLAHYRAPQFAECTTLDDVMTIEEVASACDLFIGAGGTMTREMAVLGVPTISVYRDEMLDVDRHLIAEGAFAHMPELSAQSALNYLHQHERSVPSRPLLAKGKEAYELIKSQVTNANA